jgi:hypothetical protein
MWRQGDVFIQSVAAIPAHVDRHGHGVLVEGEATGHSHRVEDLDTVQVFQRRGGQGELYLRVIADAARIVHQEHAAITLPRGTYRVWKQREYAPGAIRWVVD